MKQKAPVLAEVLVCRLVGVGPPQVLSMLVQLPLSNRGHGVNICHMCPKKSYRQLHPLAHHQTGFGDESLDLLW